MAAAEPTEIFYDAECGFCRATVGVVLVWDRHRRLTPVALQDPAAAGRLSDLSEGERMASWHLIEPDGSRRSGGAALAPLFETLPRGTRLAQLARRFPGAAERLYGLTAEHRDRLAKLMPSRLRASAEETIRRRAGDSSARAAGLAPADPPPAAAPAEAADAEPAKAVEQPKRAPDGVPAPGFPEPPGKDPGALPRDRDPHHVLNNPVVDDPDLTEWPDPYETREDPRDPVDPDGQPFGEEPHPPTGATSTSEPHPSQDPEAGDRWEGPKRDKLDQ
jgi:predicted DCC family thiol-disulfide oxidoreductase YuxK